VKLSWTAWSGVLAWQISARCPKVSHRKYLISWDNDRRLLGESPVILMFAILLRFQFVIPIEK
jgi:hypothetical protein